METTINSIDVDNIKDDDKVVEGNSVSLKTESNLEEERDETDGASAPVLESDLHPCENVSLEAAISQEQATDQKILLEDNLDKDIQNFEENRNLSITLDMKDSIEVDLKHKDVKDEVDDVMEHQESIVTDTDVR